MPKTEYFSILDDDEIEKTARLIGIEEEENREELIKKIKEEINPDEERWIDLYREAANHLDIDWNKYWNSKKFRKALYEDVCEKIRKSIEDLDEGEKKELAQQIEENIDDETIERLEKSKNFSRRGTAVGGGILVLQGGAVAITGSNLGICMLMTSGLSGLSGLIGITFPFAAYAGAATAGGWILTAAGFLASGPVIAVAGGAMAAYYGYSIYKKKTTEHLVKLANVNYIIESKRKLMGK